MAAQLRNVLVDVGRRREALTYDKLAVSVMPFMPGRLGQSFALLESTGTPDVAARFDQAVKWWPRNTMLYTGRIGGMLDRGAVDEATAFVRAMPDGVRGIDRAALLAVLTDAATRQKGRVRQRCVSAVGDMLLAQTCLAALVQLGDQDSVFAMTDRLFPKLTGTTQDEMDRQFLVRPRLFGSGALLTPPMAPMRRDPRFLPLAQRIGLTAYWRTGRWPDFCTTTRPEAVCAKLRA